MVVVDGGTSFTKAEHHFSLQVSTVKRYMERHRQNTLHFIARPTGRRRTVTAHHEQHLLAQLDTHPDATLQEHADLLEVATGLKVSFKTVDRVFGRHKITHNKTLVARERSEQLHAASWARATLVLDRTAPLGPVRFRK